MAVPEEEAQPVGKQESNKKVKKKSKKASRKESHAAAAREGEKTKGEKRKLSHERSDVEPSAADKDPPANSAQNGSAPSKAKKGSSKRVKYEWGNYGGYYGYRLGDVSSTLGVTL